MGSYSYYSKPVRGHFLIHFLSSLLPFSLCLLFLPSIPYYSHALPIPYETRQVAGLGPSFYDCLDSCRVQPITYFNNEKQTEEYLCSRETEGGFLERIIVGCMESCHGKEVNLQEHLASIFRDILCSPEDQSGNGRVVSPSVAKKSAIPSSTEPLTNTNTAAAAEPPTVHQPSSPKLSSGVIAGIVAGSAVGGISAIFGIIFFLVRRHRKQEPRALPSDSHNGHSRTRSLEFLTLNLESSQNPWIQYPKSSGTTIQVQRGSTAKLNGDLRPVESRRQSSIGQNIKKVRDSLTTIISTGQNGKAETSTTLPTESHGLRRKSVSSWAWRALKGRDYTSSGDCLRNPAAVKELKLYDTDNEDNNISPTGTHSSVDELIGVAVTKTKTRSLPFSHRKSSRSLRNSSCTSFSSSTTFSSKHKSKAGLRISLPLTAPPPPKIPTPPVAAVVAPRRERNPPPAPIATMVIPVPSATATATAKLASYALFRPSIARYSSPDISPASCCCDCQTDCEAETPITPNHICATGHSSCVWSCSSSSASSATTSPLAPGSTFPSLGKRLSQYHPSAAGENDHAGRTVTRSRVSFSKPVPMPIPTRVPRRHTLQLQSAEGELPPSPRRLPEEIAAITQRSREQQEELLRKLYYEVNTVNSQLSMSSDGKKGSFCNSVTTSGDRQPVKHATRKISIRSTISSNSSTMRRGSSESNIQYGVYGSSWPERI